MSKKTAFQAAFLFCILTHGTLATPAIAQPGPGGLGLQNSSMPWSEYAARVREYHRRTAGTFGGQLSNQPKSGEPLDKLLVPPRDPILDEQADLYSASSRGKSEYQLRKWGSLLSPDRLTQKDINCLKSFEAVRFFASSQDVFRLLLLRSPRLRRLEILEAEQFTWQKAEECFADLAAKDPELSGIFEKQLSQIEEVCLNSGDGLRGLIRSQEGFEKALATARTYPHINGIALTVWPLNGLGRPQGPGATDLRSLARWNSLKSLDLRVGSLSDISLAFPPNLKRLTLREMDLADEPLTYLRLPRSLRQLRVQSDNARTRAFFSTQAKSIPGLEIVLEDLPAGPSLQPKIWWRLAGTWVQEANPQKTMAIEPLYSDPGEPLETCMEVFQTNKNAGAPWYLIAKDKDSSIRLKRGEHPLRFGLFELHSEYLVVLPKYDAYPLADTTQMTTAAKWFEGKWRRVKPKYPPVQPVSLEQSKDSAIPVSTVNIPASEGNRTHWPFLFVTVGIVVLAGCVWIVPASVLGNRAKIAWAAVMLLSGSVPAWYYFSSGGNHQTQEQALNSTP